MKKLIIQFLLKKVLKTILGDKKIQDWILKMEKKAEKTSSSFDDILIDILQFSVEALKKV